MFLPPNLRVIERGWLSANQVYLWSDSFLDVIDSGFCTHQMQTLALLRLQMQALPDVTPRFLINTHLHSDHCGGNAALADEFHFKLLVPSAEFDSVQDWNEPQLGFSELGQPCPVFSAFGAYQANTVITLGNLDWEIYQAPGHEDQAQLLFNHEHEILISGDALWEKGFGALFPNPFGSPNFDGAFSTIELIAELKPKVVIPGHGGIFDNVSEAIDYAHERLVYLRKNPERNLIHVVNVLLKFKMLEWQECQQIKAIKWFESTPMMQRIAQSLNQPIQELFQQSLHSLVKSKAIQISSQSLLNI